MDHTGTDLGVDLYDLALVAKHYFPTVTQDYRAALSDLQSPRDLYLADGMIHAMNRASVFGVPNHLQQVWTEAMSDLRHMLSETATSLDLTSEALMLAVRTYADADEWAATELNRRLREFGEPRPDPAHH